MPTTRHQARAGVTTKASPTHKRGGRSKGRKHEPREGGGKAAKTETKIGEEGDDEKTTTGEKRDTERVEGNGDKAGEEPPVKRQKVEEGRKVGKVYQPGVIERGHIYFFYRPRVQLEEAHSLDEVRNFHMLLIPRSPEFSAAAESAEKSTGIQGKSDPEKSEAAEMKVLEPGADVVPSQPSLDQPKQKYRLVTIGKKHLPDPEQLGTQGGRKQVFWATVTAMGDNLDELRSGLGPKEYETKTRGTRHEAANRLAGRGAYAIVNTEASTPSKRETHLGYHLSHPSPDELGDVQRELGIFTASSFIIQVKNPLAPVTGGQPIRSKGAEYPEWVMHDVFGAAGQGETEPTRGREEYGLRFASCETPELLDYLNTQLLMIAARSGEEGLEESLGEGRGEALQKTEEGESKESINRVFQELGEQVEKHPPEAEALEGQWV